MIESGIRILGQNQSGLPAGLYYDQTDSMTTTNPRAGWEKVGDQFYRKIQLYESLFDPDLELENYLVAGAPYSGALGAYD